MADDRGDDVPPHAMQPLCWDTVLKEIERARASWGEALEAFNDSHREGHQRLRKDLSRLAATVENNFEHFDNMTAVARAKLGTLEIQAAKPIDATAAVMSMKAIFTLLACALTIAASLWSLSGKIDAQRIAWDAANKVTEIQIAAMQDMVRKSDARTELLRIEVQSLKETVIGKGK